MFRRIKHSKEVEKTQLITTLQQTEFRQIILSFRVFLRSKIQFLAMLIKKIKSLSSRNMFKGNRKDLFCRPKVLFSNKIIFKKKKRGLKLNK